MNLDFIRVSETAHRWIPSLCMSLQDLQPKHAVEYVSKNDGEWLVDRFGKVCMIACAISTGRDRTRDHFRLYPLETPQQHMLIIFVRSNG
jgi:hypothetical protein